ncbi:MAG: YceD family protein [Actinomycetota bacterium]
MIAAIDVRDLVGQPGATKRHHLEARVEGLGTELARLLDDAPVTGDLLLESVVEGVLVSGALRGTLSLRCARCLKESEQPFAVEVHELFVTEPDEEADDYPFGPDGSIEPEQMLRDAIGVELPFSPLCRPDCLGLCPVCGGDRNLDECPGHVEADPRWAALDRLWPMFDEN